MRKIDQKPANIVPEAAAEGNISLDAEKNLRAAIIEIARKNYQSC